MTRSPISIEAPSHAWLNLGDWGDRDSLVGNRAGFEALQSAIHRLLSDNPEQVMIDSEEIQINFIELKDKQAPVPETSFKEKSAICGILILLASIFLLGIASLLTLIKSLFT